MHSSGVSARRWLFLSLCPLRTLKPLSPPRPSHAFPEDDDDPEMLALIENGGDAPEGGAFP